MSACPFCQEPMRATFLEGLPREECEGCGAVWMEGEALARVMGRYISEVLLKRAKGQPGKCKHCRAELRYVPSCPACAHAAPTCPRCATAPLAVVKALDVELEVCSGCSGVALDAGELNQLQRAAGTSQKASQPVQAPRPPVPPGGVTRCAQCQRKLKPQNAFLWEDQLYCGSCAPQGASPCDGELTKASPSAEPTVGGMYGSRGMLQDGPTESAFLWLFSKLFDR